MAKQKFERDKPHLNIGTMGHIDHGKTALVGALTGVATDRLPEERERGISIELGFAPLELPSGRRLSVVDVPGHERFVRTMVAGASGIDLFLMVVAADDGVMPQTREHAAVLAALGVERGVVAVTKADLADPARAAAEGAHVEDKGISLVVHTRTAPDPAGALARLHRPVAELAAGGPLPEVQIDFEEDKTQTAVATTIRDNLAAVGIPAALRPKPLADYQQFAVTGEQELFRLGWIAPYPSGDAILTPLFRSGFPNNLTGLSSPAVDEPLLLARSEGDPADRK
ncbi:MAG: GTP-binding protein, partial [Actinobacteria bacterium]|nr:GTP-binding protein [Actinomycetota bacterium]